jgi:hypothetical protein
LGRAVAALSVALAVAAPLASASTSDPRLALTTKGMATAHSALPTSAELGRAWQAMPSSTPSPSVITCQGLQPDEAGLVETGLAGAVFDKGPFENVAATVRVFRTAAEAKSAWKLTRGSTVIKCAERYLRSRGEQVTLAGTFSFGGGLPARAAGFQVVSTLTRKPALGQGAPLKVRVYNDLLLISNGKTQEYIAFSALGAPLSASFEHRVAHLLAERSNGPVA